PSGPALYSGSSLIPIRAAASAHCFFRCSVGATTVICCTTWWCSSHDARVSANVVLPAPGVATARKSRGCSWMYLSIAPCCQARSLLAVPQGARPGNAGDRWCEAEAAVVVTVSVGGGGSGGSATKDDRATLPRAVRTGARTGRRAGGWDPPHSRRPRRPVSPPRGPQPGRHPHADQGHRRHGQEHRGEGARVG